MLSGRKQSKIINLDSIASDEPITKLLMHYCDSANSKLLTLYNAKRLNAETASIMMEYYPFLYSLTVFCVHDLPCDKTFLNDLPNMFNSLSIEFVNMISSQSFKIRRFYKNFTYMHFFKGRFQTYRNVITGDFDPLGMWTPGDPPDNPLIKCGIAFGDFSILYISHGTPATQNDISSFTLFGFDKIMFYCNIFSELNVLAYNYYNELQELLAGGSHA